MVVVVRRKKGGSGRRRRGTEEGFSPLGHFTSGTVGSFLARAVSCSVGTRVSELERSVVLHLLAVENVR